MNLKKDGGEIRRESQGKLLFGGRGLSFLHSCDSLFERGVGRKVGTDYGKFVCDVEKFAHPLDARCRMISCRLGEAAGEIIGIEFLFFGIAILDQLPDKGGEHPGGGRAGSEGLVEKSCGLRRRDSANRMPLDHMADFMGENKGEPVVIVAEIYKSIGDEDKSAR